MKIVIAPNPYRDKQFYHSLRAKQILDEIGVSTSLCLPFVVDRNFDLPDNLQFDDIETALQDADALICLGGDGTILHASKLVAGKDIPILGVNIGTLGFMAALEAQELPMLKTIRKDDVSVEERMMLEVSVVSNGKTIFTDYALNDAVVTKGAVARVLQMKVCCNEAEVMSFSGDGVILCTPTGSTAYSLSAGGPIVEPTTKNILITPICAHGQNCSCFVTESSRVISVSVDKIGRRSAFLSVDGGRAFRLESTDTVLVRRAERSTKLIRLNNRNFFETISKKFYNR